MLGMIFKPWTFVMVALTGWTNRQQQEAIIYLREDNRILREKLGQKRVLGLLRRWQYRGKYLAVSLSVIQPQSLGMLDC